MKEDYYMRYIIIFCLTIGIFCSCRDANTQSFIQGSKIKVQNDAQTVCTRFPPPEGTYQKEYNDSSFSHYLRHFKLLPSDQKVELFDGSLKPNQSAHAAVLDIDVGKRDLQQCADAIMRLRAEFLYSINEHEKIHFNFTNGFRADYSTWKKGNRIKVSGNEVDWVSTEKDHSGYDSFKKYLEIVFAYAGTQSLSQELKHKKLKDIVIGDVFIFGGFPGHAVIVMDIAYDKKGIDKYFLLAQSFMPAQQIHILKNPSNNKLNPWYSTKEIGDQLITPEWTFKVEDLMSF